MIRTVDAKDRTYVSASLKEKSWLFELPHRQSLVRLDVWCDHDVLLNGINYDGEVLLLDSGKVIKLHAQLVDFKALEVVSEFPFTVCATATDGLEFRDPTPLVITEGKPVDPVRLAMAEEIKRIMVQWKDQGMFNDPVQAEKEYDEFVDDLVDGDMEFDDGMDEFGLPAAAEQEEERANQERIAAAEKKAAEEAKDVTPVAEQVLPEPAPAPAAAVVEGGS